MSNKLKLVYVHEGEKVLITSINSVDFVSVDEALEIANISIEDLANKFHNFNINALFIEENISFDEYMDNVNKCIMRKFGRATTQREMTMMYDIKNKLMNKYHMFIADDSILLDHENSLKLIGGLLTA